MEYPNNDLKTSVVFPIYLCSKELIRKYAEELKKYDLTYTQYIVLMYFINEKESNLKRIGEVMLLDSSTLTPLLKKMEKKGYITRKKSKLDERNLTLTITKKGLELEPFLREIPAKIKELFNLSEKEIAILHKTTYKILNCIVEDK